MNVLHKRHRSDETEPALRSGRREIKESNAVRLRRLEKEADEARVNKLNEEIKELQDEIEGIVMYSDS